MKECGNISHLWIPADSALPGGRADNVMEYFLEDLLPSTMYDIKVAAATQQGEGPYSLGLAANTEEDGENLLNSVESVKGVLPLIRTPEMWPFLPRSTYTLSSRVCTHCLS